MIRKTYARVPTNDLDGTLETLRELVGRGPDLRATFGRFDIALIGSFCVLSGPEQALDRYRDTVGPLVVDDVDAALASVTQRGAELTVSPFEGPVGLTFLSRHSDGVEYEYVQLRPELNERVFGSPGTPTA